MGPSKDRKGRNDATPVRSNSLLSNDDSDEPMFTVVDDIADEDSILNGDDNSDDMDPDDDPIQKLPLWTDAREFGMIGVLPQVPCPEYGGSTELVEFSDKGKRNRGTPQGHTRYKKKKLKMTDGELRETLERAVKDPHATNDESNLACFQEVESTGKKLTPVGRQNQNKTNAEEICDTKGTAEDRSQVVEESSKKEVQRTYATFRDFLLKPDLLQAIVDSGLDHPSEVQRKIIPQAILGTDVICQARSDVSRTATLVIATLQQIEPCDGQVSVLVLSHTRDSAFQIKDEYERFCQYFTNIEVAVFVGGLSVKTDKQALEKNCPHILVGTPGRVLSLVRDKVLNLQNLKHFILDGSGEMLEHLDMRSDVQDIFCSSPRRKQVMMFSSMLTKELRHVCKKFMHDPLEVYIDDKAKLTLRGLTQHYVKVNGREKNEKLFHLLDNLEFKQVIIYVKSVKKCIVMSNLLDERNYPAITIHRSLTEEERLDRDNQFKTFQKRILVTTTLFGRGMDTTRVNIIINYDMPADLDTYLNRVTNASCSGTKALAIWFVTDKADSTDSKFLKVVQDVFKVNISKLPVNVDVSTYTEMVCF